MIAVGIGLRGAEAMKVVYQPDILGEGRLFMVALEVPTTASAVTVTVPPTVQLLDRTPLPAKTALRKYYFRALKPTPKADLVFAGEGGKATVSVVVWSYADLREHRTLKGVQLPRRWPLGEPLPELKERQTVTSDAEKQRLKGRRPPSQWLEIADEAIWQMQPDSTIPRWHWVNVKEGCPVHGTKVYEGKAFYPWLNDRQRPLRTYTASLPYPWQMVCPVGKETYPSNHLGEDDFTSGPFPDDGIGGACLHDGKRYGFVAEIAQSYCHQMLKVAPQCARGYLMSGDPRYAHKALVALSRLAVEYAYLATMTQHRHRNNRHQVDRLGPAPFSEGPCLKRSGFTVYCIDQPTYQCRIAEAYDAIWPAIDADTEIIPFLQGKGFDVRTGEDVRRFIEENLMAVWMQGAMDGSTASNEPYAQWGLARMAEMLDYRRGTEFMAWLYDRGGKMRTFLPNDFFRDGAPYESSGGYNGMHVVALGPIVESVQHIRELRPELYSDGRYPDLSRSRRYHNVFDFSMNTVNIDRVYPRVGDDGAQPRYSVHARRAFQNGGAAAFEHAYKVFKDPKFAWALARTEGWKPSVDFPYAKEEIETQAATWQAGWNDASRLSDGYGLAMLRGGAGNDKRSLWMMYGRPRGHTHDDMLHMGLDAFGSEILGHLGYPRNWNYWTKCWTTQILAKQIPFVQMTATAQLFADAGPVHVAEALATKFSSPIADGKPYVVDDDTRQRRTLALIDVDDERFYAVDIYRIHGGREIWWSFHAQEDKGFRTEGLKLVAQPKGTVAGADVPYGDETWLKANGCRRNNYGYHGPMYGLAHLYNVQRDKQAGAWSADWALRDSDVFHFGLHMADSDGAETIVCDGTSPAGGNPYEMKFLLMHKEGPTPVQATFASVMQVWRGEPVVRGVRRLELSGTGDAVALEVTLKDGRDVVFSSPDGKGEWRTADGIVFSGRFGLWRERQGRGVAVALVGGTRLDKENVGCRTESAWQSAKIVAVDRQAVEVTLDRPVPGAALVGRVVHVVSPGRRVSLRVQTAREADGKTVLGLEFDPCVGIGRVTGCAADRVLTSTPFRLAGFRYYQGARLANSDGTAEHRVAGVQNGKFVLLETAPGEEALAESFHKGDWFRIYDYGVGDEVVWPSVLSISTAE
jgi:hypothetical protein